MKLDEIEYYRFWSINAHISTFDSCTNAQYIYVKLKIDSDKKCEKWNCTEEDRLKIKILVENVSTYTVYSVLFPIVIKYPKEYVFFGRMLSL